MIHGLKKFIEHKAYLMRVESLRMTTQAGSGHPTSALSAADLVAALFFHAMRYDPKDTNNPNNDHFILSKGHAAPILYAAWKEVGELTDADLMTYRQFNSVLEGHPTPRFAHIDAATGSLGMGLSIGAGLALTGALDHRPFYTYVLMGDSEITEGSVWEAAEIASYYKLKRLIGIVDCNRLGQSTETIHGYHTKRYAQKFESFGWKSIVIDGHDMRQIIAALDKARTSEERPTIIIAKTIKGYGIDSVENKEGFHGRAFTPEELERILPAMERRFSTIAHFHSKHQWRPLLPPAAPEEKPSADLTMPHPPYKKGEMIATRKAYGNALAALGTIDENVVSLDAEVKNSTFADIFEKKFPTRFFQCFVAEQNMASMGVGFARLGKKPFISTFSAFFSRAHDQIRMAAISRSGLFLVGSHAGVSIGQDGPSQMGLEDIAIMRTLPDSYVFYPSDGVSTHALVHIMSEQKDRICYLRTTRAETPIIYAPDQTFNVGGCHVLRQSDADHVCVIAAGITLHEALKAYELLQKENISICIIDLYSIKPLDEETIKKHVLRCKRVITVEDHYLAGGLGEAVTYALRNESISITCLAVHELPRSGKPDELLSWAGIDAAHIADAVRKIK